MKRASKFNIFLSSPVNHGLFLSIFFLLLTLPLGLAYNPSADDPRLEELDKNSKAITSEYKAILESKKNFIDDEMERTEDSLVAEDDKEKRKKLVDHLRDLKKQHDELSDKLRMINASEVVKLSNTKNKIVALLTHQSSQ